MATDSSGSTENFTASHSSRLITSKTRVSFSKHLHVKCQGKILIGLGHVPTSWMISEAKVGLTFPWGWGILLYHYCFLITILINITTVTVAAAATIEWSKIERE